LLECIASGAVPEVTSNGVLNFQTSENTRYFILVHGVTENGLFEVSVQPLATVIPTQPLATVIPAAQDDEPGQLSATVASTTASPTESETIPAAQDASETTSPTESETISSTLDAEFEIPDSITAEDTLSEEPSSLTATDPPAEDPSTPVSTSLPASEEVMTREPTLTSAPSGAETMTVSLSILEDEMLDSEATFPGGDDSQTVRPTLMMTLSAAPTEDQTVSATSGEILQANEEIATTDDPITRAPSDKAAANAECSNAPSLTVRETLSASIVEDTAGGLSNAITCGGNNLTGSQGLWYAVEGSNRVSKILLQADFAAQVSVFLAESDSCADLTTCVSGTLSTRLGHTSSITSWQSSADSSYLLFVHGGEEGELGNFNITLEQTQRPRNDVCSGAKSPSLGAPVNDWTYLASSDLVDDCSNLGTTMNTTGIWYAVNGTGAPYIATLTPGYEGARLSVYTGDCDMLRCADGTDGIGLEQISRLSAGVSERTFEWTTEAGVTHYILVHGAREEDVGEFYLTVSVP
jgi:hypothetical protein